MAGFVFTISGLVAAGTLGKRSHEPIRSAPGEGPSERAVVPPEGALRTIAEAYCSAMSRCGGPNEVPVSGTASSCTDQMTHHYGTILTRVDCPYGVDAGELERYLVGLRTWSCSDEAAPRLTSEVVRRLCSRS